MTTALTPNLIFSGLRPRRKARKAPIAEPVPTHPLLWLVAVIKAIVLG